MTDETRSSAPSGTSSAIAFLMDQQAIATAMLMDHLFASGVRTKAATLELYQRMADVADSSHEVFGSIYGELLRSKAIAFERAHPSDKVPEGALSADGATPDE